MYLEQWKKIVLDECEKIIPFYKLSKEIRVGGITVLKWFLFEKDGEWRGIRLNRLRNVVFHKEKTLTVEAYTHYYDTIAHLIKEAKTSSELYALICKNKHAVAQFYKFSMLINKPDSELRAIGIDLKLFYKKKIFMRKFMKFWKQNLYPI